jgi:DNA-binding transcriptional LysR family regulator
MPDRVTSMNVFVRVATLLNLSAAGRALGLSPTMVTKHIAATEERLGVKLLHRSTRRLTLTEAGRNYLESCERILADIEEAETSARADHLEPRGTLRLNVPFSFGIREIAPALAEFARLHRDLSIDLGLSDRYVDLIDEGWDLAVRIGLLRDSSLVARWLAPCHVIVCGAPAYLAAKGTPQTLAELATHNCLGYTMPSPANADRWLFGANGDIAAKVSGNLRASNGDALLAAALAGQGLIYQPSFLIGDHLRSGSLVALPLDEKTATLPIHAILPSGRQPPAKVRAFVEFLARRFRPDPPWDLGLET